MKLSIAVLSSLVLSLALYSAEIKVACIGDSITAGIGAKNRGKNNYPALLQASLGEKYIVKNYGVSGIKMTNYKGHKNWAKALEFKPNIVIIKLGTNDTKGRKFNDPNNKSKFNDSYKKSFKEMLDSLKAMDSKPTIYLCTPVPVFKDRWGINEKATTEDIIPAIKAIASEYKLTVIDLYGAMEGKGDMVPDGVHPNEHGYKIMAELIHKTISK